MRPDAGFESPSLHLREVLACEIVHDNDIAVVLVGRQGLQFSVFGYLLGDHAALVRDSTTLEHLSRLFDLPVRVLDGDEGVFLGLQTTRALQEGRDFYRPRVSKLPLC